MRNLDTSLTLKMVDKWSEPAKRLAGMNADLAKGLSDTHKQLLNIGNQKKAVSRLKDYQEAIKKANAANNEALTKTKALRLARDEETQRIKAARAELKKLSAQKANGEKVDAKAIEDLKRQTKENKTLHRELKKAEKAHERAIKQRRLATEESVRLRSKLKAEGIETKNLTNAQNKLGDAYAATEKKIKSVSDAQGKLSHAQEKYDRVSQQAANTTILAAGIDRVGRGALNALSKPASYAISRQSAFTEVEKFVKDADMSVLSKQIKELAKLSPMGADAVAQLVAAGGKINLTSEEALKFAKRSEELSVAYGISIDQALESIPKLRDGMNLTMDQVGVLGDAINHLGDSTTSNAPNILNIVSRVGSTAKAAGLAAPQIAALAAVIDGAAPSAEIAATSMKNLLLSLNSGEQMAAGKQSILEDLGFDSTDIARRMQENAVGTIREVLAAIADRDASERSGIAEALFGRESIAAVNSLVGNLEAYDAAMLEVADTSNYLGSAERERAKQMQTTEMRLRMLQSNYQDTLANLGEKLLPTINTLASAAGKLLDAVNWLSEKFPLASKVAMILVGGLGALAVAIAPVLVSVAALRVAVAGLGVSAQKAALQTAAANAGMGVGPGGGSVVGTLTGKGNFGAKFKTLAKGGGAAAAILSALAIGSTLMSEDENINKGAEISKSIGGGVGGIAGGALAGAAIGSVVPVVGTAIGGIIGSIAGAAGGGWLGEKIGGWIFGDDGNGKPGDIVTANPPIKAAGSQQNYADNSQVSITVNQLPGEDPKALAKKVIDEIDRRKARRRGGAYADHS